MAEQIIKTATAPDEASIIAVVVLAFSADPAARWTWPDQQRQPPAFPQLRQGTRRQSVCPRERLLRSRLRRRGNVASARG